jgi:hypothetical protein
MEIRLARTRINMILEISVVFGWGQDNSHKYLEIYMSSTKQGREKTKCSIGTQPTVLFTANS